MSHYLERPDQRNQELRGPLIAGGIASLIAVATLAGCAGGQPQTLEIETVSSTGYEMTLELATYRTEVLELCNTGPGASEMRMAWKDLGFEERSGLTWNQAIEYNVDYAYSSDPAAVVNIGEFVYPTVLSVAENCQEAAFIISNGVELAQPRTALPAIEAYRESPDLNGVLVELFSATR